MSDAPFFTHTGIIRLIGLTGRIVVGYEAGDGVGIVRADDDVGAFLDFRERVADGYSDVGDAEHGQVVEIVAEDDEPVSAQTLFHAEDRRCFRYTGSEYLEVTYTVVEDIGIAAYRALCVRAECFGDFFDGSAVAHGKEEHCARKGCRRQRRAGVECFQP